MWGEHSASVLNLHIGSVLQDKLILTDQQLDFLKQGLSKLGQEPLVDPQPFFFSCSRATRGHQPNTHQLLALSRTRCGSAQQLPHPRPPPHAWGNGSCRARHGASADTVGMLWGSKLVPPKGT